MMKKMGFCICATAAAVLMTAAGSAVNAQDFYKGKTITLYVGQTSASGFDAYARVLQRNISRHIPGEPNVIVQHMPGAGGSKANEHTALIAAKDGTAFTITMPGSILQPLISDRSKFRYDPTELSYIGNADSGTRVCILAARTGVKTFADMMSKPLTLGATAPGGSLHDYARFKQVVLGGKFKIVTGYPGSGDVLIAVERGEIDGVCGLDISSLRTLKPDWVGSPDYVITVQVTFNESKSNADLDKMGVPTIWKFIPPEKRELVELIVKQQAFHRPFFAPPNIPAAQLATLRTAFMATLKDQVALQDAEKMRLAVDPSDGAEVTAAVKSMYAAPKALLDEMARATSP